MDAATQQAIILASFDLITELSKESPQLIASLARLKEKGVTPENIAAERAALDTIDTSDPLGKVPDPSAPGPVN